MQKYGSKQEPGTICCQNTSGKKWIKRFQELNDLELVKLPRCLKEPVAKAVKLSINTFTDASENAYTAAAKTVYTKVYLLWH